MNLGTLFREVLRGPYRDEFALQNAIESRLKGADVLALREFILGENNGKRDTIDFYVPNREAPLTDGFGIEVKVDGSLAAVTRQLYRYAAYDSVRSLMLVTTRAIHRGVAREMRGKRVEVVHLEGTAF